MAPRIPEEIIHKFISDVLSVSDEVFSYTDASSPYAQAGHSSSAILLVSKCWLRVATPLLYDTVILRTKGQAQALAAALSANPTLGGFIKKLRVEGPGGFAISMHKILQTAKRSLKEIALTLKTAKGDTTSGLCRGIPLINPRRLILACGPKYAWGDRDSDPEKKLVEVLARDIPKWTNLVSFEMPAQNLHGYETIHYSGFHNLKNISEAVALAPNLHILVLSHFEDHLFNNNFVPPYLSAIVGNPSLREIRPKARAQKALRPIFIQTVRDNAKLAKLISLDDFDIELTSQPIYAPQLATNPMSEEAIPVWDRVLSYLYRDHLSKERSTDPRNVNYYERDPDGSGLPARCLRPLLVCKLFLRLGTPYLYESPYISSKALQGFSRQLKLRPSLGQHVRRLLVQVPTTDVEKYQADLRIVLQRVPCIVGFTGLTDVVMSWAIFEDLGLQCGANFDTFLGVCVEPGPKKAASAVFSRFSRMETFAWDSETAFDTLPILGAFGKLEYLIIRKAHPSFFAAFSRMTLPSLRKVALDAASVASRAFFAKHGYKVEELLIADSALGSDILNKCLSLKNLTINFAKVNNGSESPLCSHEKTFKLCDEHPVLERIALNPKSFSKNSKKDKHAIAQFLENLDLTPFPALREIHHPAFSWERTDATMLKLPWVKHLEKFQVRDIWLVDRQDTVWKPRRLFIPQKSGN